MSVSSASQVSCRTLSQADPARDWAACSHLRSRDPGLCRGPLPQAWPFCPFLGSVICPCLRLRDGGRQGRQRQAEGKKPPDRVGKGTAHEAEERRHRAVGEPADPRASDSGQRAGNHPGAWTPFQPQASWALRCTPISHALCKCVLTPCTRLKMQK